MGVDLTFLGVNPYQRAPPTRPQVRPARAGGAGLRRVGRTGTDRPSYRNPAPLTRTAWPAARAGRSRGGLPATLHAPGDRPAEGMAGAGCRRGRVVGLRRVQRA